MLTRWTVALVFTLLPSMAAAQGATTPKTQPTAQDTSALKTEKDKLSYAMGMDLGNQLAKQAVDLDPDVFARGLKDALAHGKTLMTEDDARVLITQLQQQLATKQMAEAKVASEKNKTEGAAFLEENKKKPGVVALPSGLQYKVLTEGKGPKPTLADTVTCHYRGTLIDGKEFDSSYRRGQPASFPLNRVIKGWTEALQLMPVGSKWQLFIPSELGYGERGMGADIGPNATLIFEVELMEIKK